MPQVCKQCSHINPDEASFCYFDGVILAHHGAGGPINAGSQPFPSQFVFPSGQVCRNFDQLAMTCQKNWPQAVDLLKHGFLAQFLGGLGRVDLAMAAKEAANFPDQDRGLDQFLGRLPSQVLENSKLKVEPREVNLGQMAIGADRQFELQLTNLGMRLLYGSVSADCKWLTLGDAPGNPEKLFQFHGEATIPVQVRGQFLRAGVKPLEGKLIIDSNGGTIAIKVRVDVPITPFADGVLAGSLTPRQIAEKAKANPTEAAPLFEKGAVAEWFKKNGWIYPVQGPSASGLGAVQQFFEALGLAKAPKVEVPTQAIELRGEIGRSVPSSIEVRTPEKKPVFAYAVCNQPWVDVSKVKLEGRKATIAVVVNVPNQPGETLKAEITVTGNGNQRFKVPLTLTVEGEPLFSGFGSTAAVPQGTGDAADFAQLGTSPIPTGPVPASTSAAPAATTGTLPDVGGPTIEITAPTRRRREQTPMWTHMLPLAILLVTLLGFILRDLMSKPEGGGGEDLDRTPRLALFFDYGPGKERKNTFSFGLEMVDPKDPKNPDRKRLTYSSYGQSNSTVLRIDGNNRLFGKEVGGRWEDMPRRFGRGMTGTWRFSELIHLNQTVEIVPGEPVEIEPGITKRLLDTCLIRYRLENHDGNRTHRIGLRFLLDTYIGKNDFPPFVIPGQAGLESSCKDFAAPDPIPDFIQAQENPSLQDPGVVAQVNLKLGGSLEPPTRVSLTHWPGPNPAALRNWEVPVRPMEGDSAVVIYWEEKDLLPGKVRELGFSFGLGSVTTSGAGQIGLAVGGSFAPRGELTVVALVPDPQPKQEVTLELPEGFELINSPAVQPVPPGSKGPDGRPRPSPVTWRVRSSNTGTFIFTVQSSTGVSQSRKVTIKKSDLF